MTSISPQVLSTHKERWVTQITPMGRGGIAVLYIQGDLWQLNHALPTPFFTTPIKFADHPPPLNRIIFGSFLGEDVVLCRVADSHYELNCHGGQLAVHRIMHYLAQHGYESIPAEEALLLNVHLSMIDKEQQLALTRAPTLVTANLLLQQTTLLWQNWGEHILQLAKSKHWDQLNEEIQQLILRTNIGLHLLKPFTVVIAGLPNAGKSSLLNALLGYERTIVYPEPGTTRDLVRATAAIKGWPVEFVDTAGLREAHDSIEATGIQIARNVIESADLTLLLVDLTTLDTPETQLIVHQYPQALLIGNKVDLIAADHIQHSCACLISASKRWHLETMLDMLASKLIPSEIPTGPIPFTQRQQHILNEIEQAIRQQDSEEVASMVGKLIAG